MSARPAPPAAAAPPVHVTWAGEADEPTRRAVEAAVLAGVRRGLAFRGASHPGGPAVAGRAAGAGADGSWGADATGQWWTMPSYSGGGAPVAVPVRRAPGAADGDERLPLGDVLMRSAFPALAVIRLSVSEWVSTGSDPYVTSPSLARAVQWGQALYGAQGFTVLERRGRHPDDRFLMVPLEDQLLISRFGRSGPVAADQALDLPPGLQVTERGKVLPLGDFRVALTSTADGLFVYDLHPGARWTPAAVQRELSRTPRGERLDPAVAARVATAWLTAEGSGAEAGTLDEEVMLAHIVTMDRDIFAAMPWDQRAGFLTALSGLLWPSARQKKAMVELIASARSRTELEAMAAILREKDAYRRLFATLDGSVVELLLVLGRYRQPGPMSPRYVEALFRRLGLLPADGEDPQSPDALRRLHNSANGLSLWVRSTAEAVKDLFTLSPTELIEGIGHLAEFALVIDRATRQPPDPKAVELLRFLAEQAGTAIRTAMAGLEYAEELGTPFGNRSGGAAIAGDIADTLATALVLEVLSWFLGIGEIKEALGGAQLTERLAALLKVLSSLRRLGSAAEAAGEVGKLQRFVSALTKLAQLRDEVAAARALRLLPQQHLGEVARLAELLDVPAGAKSKVLRDLARTHNVSSDVQGLADALSLARRFDRRAEAVGGATADMAACLRRLLDTGWDRRTLARLVDAVPETRLAEWSRALSALRPEQVGRLGADHLQALAYWPRSLSFVAEAGGDVYLTLLTRNGGDHRAVEGLLHGLDLRKAEIGDPAAYQRLLDQLAGGDKAALTELSGRISQAAEVALERLRAGGRRRLLAELREVEDFADQLRRQGRTAEAAERIAYRDRLAAQVGRLSDRELSGLEHLARISEDTGAFAWDSALDLAAADRADLLPLVDDIAGRLPARNLRGIEDVLHSMLERNVGKAGRMEHAVQGGWGELYAARTLVRDLGATSLEFQAPRANRVVDILADIPGRGRVSVEVKTNLAGPASFVDRQILADLTAHAATGYTDLIYLYHPSVTAELPAHGQRMLQLFDTAELTGALTAAGRDPAAAKAAFRAWLDAGNLRVYQL
ncbi:hypothetical protein [Streptomyces erythrochromogenes]|uniref:hypothetical protein n=1 Tax=Streptomyces erythrochromogenes TaxID=285574 RepID=UPI0036909CDB